MERIIVEVQLTTRREPVDLEIPAHVPARALARRIAAALDAERDDLGQPLRYLISLLPGDRRLRSCDSLADADTWDGATLLLEPIVAAYLEGEGGVSYPLHAATLSVGRTDAGAAAPFDDGTLNLNAEPAAASVSRRHAQLLCAQGQWQITHLSQTNPTWINDHLLAPGVRMALRDGDRLRLGGVDLTIRLGFPPHEAGEETPAP